jgi:hypothetical protein
LDINARKVYPKSECGSPYPCFSREELQKAGQRGLLWGIVVDNNRREAAMAGVYGDVIQGLLESPGDYPEFERVQVDGPSVIFKYIGGQPPTSKLAST